MIAGVQETINQTGVDTQKKNERGFTVFTTSQIMSTTGNTKAGERMTVGYEQSFFYLSLGEREMIYKMCAPVFSVVSSRSARIAAMDYHIVRDKTNEDRIYDTLKQYYQIYNEYGSVISLETAIVRARVARAIKDVLFDILPDLSNFQPALLRWKKRNESASEDKCREIESWLAHPNAQDTYSDFVKKWVSDLMVHGAAAVYKEPLNNRIENIYTLAGGTVMPVRQKTVSGLTAYVQIVTGAPIPIYFSDELSFTSYMPTSARAYGNIPLEALINKICETLMFDQLMAIQADGTKPPEKMIIITDKAPFGDLDKEFNVPIDPAEQMRLETKVNQYKKGAIMTFSGHEVTVVDLSRENTMGIQMQRQKDIREEVGMVFQATNMEMSLTGSESTSGRSTSEEQNEILYSKGIYPIVKSFEYVIKHEILPFRYGPGYSLEIAGGQNPDNEIDEIQKKVTTGIFTMNELREAMGLDNLGPEYDKPISAQAPAGTDQLPFAVKNIE